jgi:hypothetical protein
MGQKPVRQAARQSALDAQAIRRKARAGRRFKRGASARWRGWAPLTGIEPVMVSRNRTPFPSVAPIA